jgi:hypothetical protein
MSGSGMGMAKTFPSWQGGFLLLQAHIRSGDAASPAAFPLLFCACQQSFTCELHAQSEMCRSFVNEALFATHFCGTQKVDKRVNAHTMSRQLGRFASEADSVWL